MDKLFLGCIKGCKVAKVILWIECVLYMLVGAVSVLILSNAGGDAAMSGLVSLIVGFAVSLLYGWLATSVGRAVKYLKGEPVGEGPEGEDNGEEGSEESTEE